MEPREPLGPDTCVRYTLGTRHMCKAHPWDKTRASDTSLGQETCVEEYVVEPRESLEPKTCVRHTRRWRGVGLTVSWETVTDRWYELHNPISEYALF